MKGETYTLKVTFDVHVSFNTELLLFLTLIVPPHALLCHGDTEVRCGVYFELCGVQFREVLMNKLKREWNS